jgi:hypothetical protein
MSARIRGEEVTIRMSVDGALQEGSFFKAKNFTITPRIDLKEEDYLGELESDLDIQFHGYDGSFEIDVQDEKPLELLSTIVDRELQHLSHPAIVFTVIYNFRQPGARDKAVVLHGVFLKPSEQGFGGRKEYATEKFEFKCKRRELVAA